MTEQRTDQPSTPEQDAAGQRTDGLHVVGSSGAEPGADRQGAGGHRTAGQGTAGQGVAGHAWSSKPGLHRSVRQTPGELEPQPVQPGVVSAPGRRPENTDWADHVAGIGVDDLRRIVLSLPVIEQAKGVLMGYYGCDAAAAFAILKRLSSTRNSKLRTVADEVVGAAARPGEGRFGPLIEYMNWTPPASGTVRQPV